MGLWHANRSPNLGQKIRPYNNGQKKKKKKKKTTTWKIVNFPVPADHSIKLKETEKKYKYQDLASESKKVWNMKVTSIPIVTGAFGTVTKGLLKRVEDLEIRGRVETIQTTALLRTTRILRRVLESWGDLLSLKTSEKLSAKTDRNISQQVNNNNNNNNNNTMMKKKRLENLRTLAVTQTPGKKLSIYAGIKNSQLE